MKSLLGVLLAFLAFGACNLPTFTPAAEQSDLPNGATGTRVSPPAAVHGPAIWSLDGTWIYYAGPSWPSPHYHLVRVRPDGSESHTLDLGDVAVYFGWPVGILRPIAPAPNGDLYVNAVHDTGGPPGVLRLRNGDVSTWVPGIPAAYGIALTPDGTHLVMATSGMFGNVQDLASMDLATGRITPLATGWPAALSPDSRELLYIAGDVTHRVADLETGATHPIATDARDGFGELALWLPDGIRILTALLEFTVQDATTGDSTRVYENPYPRAVPRNTAWSPDGGTIATWFETCARRESQPCAATHDALYLIDIADSAKTWVAGGLASSGGPITFAPDGRRVAYVMDGALYVLTAE